MLKFKNYLVEEPINFDVDGDIEDFDEINEALFDALARPIMSPQAGFLIIRGVLTALDYDFPLVYDLSDEEGEQIFVLKPDNYLYVLYSVTDDGYYEFHAEITDGDGLDDILSEGEPEEDE